MRGATTIVCLRPSLLVVVASLAAPELAAPELTAPELAAPKLMRLDGEWRLSSDAGHRLIAVVPGDLVSDLERAHIVRDPLYELGFISNNTHVAPPWASYVWTYSTRFTAPPSSLLVFEGIKMCAKVFINGEEALEATDQFLRYTMPVAGTVELKVVFDPTKDAGGRYMASSGGWDFMPYTNTREGGLMDGPQLNVSHYSVPRTFSRGIWRSVYVSTGLTLLHVVPQVMHMGQYPATRLNDGEASFVVNVTIHIWAPSAVAFEANISVAASSDTAHYEVPAGESVLVLPALSVHGPQLWWPRGHGLQTLHSMQVSLVGGGGVDEVFSVNATRMLGFRTLALVTGNDTDRAFLQRAASEEGSESFTMFLRVNGEAVYSKGANMVPMDQFEGRFSDANHRRLVQSSAEAGMNMIRIWGGGLFLPQAFYDTCDDLGILLYHDMMFAVETGQPHVAYVSDVVEKELRHQIRRLSAHPSIVIWDGCNECKVVMESDGSSKSNYYPNGTELYATFVMATVVQEDMSRIVWPSCPASGWASGVHKLTGLPTGRALVTRHDSKQGGRIEVHGPYRQGTGIPSINPGGKYYQFEVPNLEPSVTGTQYPSVFVSEFGSVVMSSFESMSSTLEAGHWSVHGGTADQDKCTGEHTTHCEGDNVMGWRNHMPDNQITTFFGKTNLSSVGPTAFQEQLYKSMVSQALDMKREIEEQRSRNSFGMLVWQLGEAWPTGGWGSLEYAAERPGQIPGGRWKPLHHLYSQGLMRDVFTACGMHHGNVSCYIVNDGSIPWSGSVSVRSVDLSTGTNVSLLDKNVSLGAGPGSRAWFALPALPDPTTNAIMVFDSGGSEMMANLAPLNAMALRPAKVTCVVGTVYGANVSITCTTDSVAAYVVLTTAAYGRFEPNAFLLIRSRQVQFISWGTDGTVDVNLLKSTLRVDHARKWRVHVPPPPSPSPFP